MSLDSKQEVNPLIMQIITLIDAISPKMPEAEIIQALQEIIVILKKINTREDVASKDLMRKIRKFLPGYCKDLPKTPEIERLFKLIDLLLDIHIQKNVNAPNKDGELLLELALDIADIEVLELLVKYGADANIFKEGDTFLCSAIRSHEIERARLLIEICGADVNKTTAGKWAPLHHAAYYYGAEIIPLLLKRGANPNVVDRYGDTPVCFAVQSGNIAAIRLLDYKAKINTLLHIAAEHGQLEVVEMLVGQGANLEAQNQNQKTPLHIAVKCCLKMVYPKIVKFLLESGAKVDIKDNQGNTPLSLAESETRHPDAELTNLLRAFSENNNSIKQVYKIASRVMLPSDSEMHAVLKPIILGYVISESETFPHKPLMPLIKETLRAFAKLINDEKLGATKEARIARLNAEAAAVTATLLELNVSEAPSPILLELQKECNEYWTWLKGQFAVEAARKFENDDEFDKALDIAFAAVSSPSDQKDTVIHKQAEDQTIIPSGSITIGQSDSRSSSSSSTTQDSNVAVPAAFFPSLSQVEAQEASKKADTEAQAGAKHLNADAEVQPE